MPFLSEQELNSLQQEIEDANIRTEEAEEELEKEKKELTEVKRKVKGVTIFFAILAGLGIASSIFFYQKKRKSLSSIDVERIKKDEALRVIDSIANSRDEYNKEAEENIEENDVDNQTNSIGESITEVKNNIHNQTVYSVQVGVFSENKFPVLSESIAGISLQGDYFKYSFGLFETLNEAQEFRRNLVQIGFRDAFVASYINGERQQIELPD